MSFMLRVVDLQRMLQFYVDALDCTVERRQVGIGLVQLRAGSARIDLVLVDSELNVPAVRRPARKGATSIISVCASNPSSACREVAGHERLLLAGGCPRRAKGQRRLPGTLPTLRFSS